jgi:hypothetical protein
MAGIIRVDLAEATFQEAPIHRPRQRDQWMLQVDDLIEPGAKQILFTRLSSFPWPHVAPRKSFLSERITNQICKESPSAKQFPGKLDFHNAPFLDSKSRTWEFFTDDYRTLSILSHFVVQWRRPPLLSTCHPSPICPSRIGQATLLD